jgi:hypothetical protein
MIPKKHQVDRKIYEEILADFCSVARAQVVKKYSHISYSQISQYFILTDFYSITMAKIVRK